MLKALKLEEAQSVWPVLLLYLPSNNLDKYARLAVSSNCGGKPKKTTQLISHQIFVLFSRTDLCILHYANIESNMEITMYGSVVVFIFTTQR